MSNLKSKLLLLLKNFGFKVLQRFGTQFSKHRDFRSSVYRRRKYVLFLYSTQKQLYPSHQVIPHLFFICNTKISFTLLCNKNRKTHHSHAGLYLILRYSQVLLLQKWKRKIYLSLVFSRKKMCFMPLQPFTTLPGVSPQCLCMGCIDFGLQSVMPGTMKGSQYLQTLFLSLLQTCFLTLGKSPYLMHFCSLFSFFVSNYKKQ